MILRTRLQFIRFLILFPAFFILIHLIIVTIIRDLIRYPCFTILPTILVVFLAIPEISPRSLIVIIVIIRRAMHTGIHIRQTSLLHGWQLAAVHWMYLKKTMVRHVSFPEMLKCWCFFIIDFISSFSCSIDIISLIFLLSFTLFDDCIDAVLQRLWVRRCMCRWWCLV